MDGNRRVPRASRLQVRGALAALAASVALLAAWTPGASAALPEQGLYDVCYPASAPGACAPRLLRISQAGFRTILNSGSLYYTTTPEQLTAFADAAQVAGVKVIWPLMGSEWWGSDPNGNGLLNTYPKLAERCGCHDNQGLLRYVVERVRNHPATWGYYVADEPGADARDALNAFIGRIKAVDSAHPAVIVTCGVCGGGDPDGARTAPFANLDAVLGTDTYPVTYQPLNDRSVFDAVAANARGLQRVADGAGRETIMTLQAWDWNDSHFDAQASGVSNASTRFPTRQEIQMQRDAAILHSRPRMILWFTLQQVIGWEEDGKRPWYWRQPPDPDQRWANLVGGAFAPDVRAPAAAPPPAVARTSTSAPRPANRRPVARVRWRAPRPRRGQRIVRVTLDAGRSYDPDGRLVAYRWDLGADGRIECRRKRCTVRLRRGASRRVRLTVVDERAAAGTARVSLRIRWAAVRSVRRR
jgi:hypothetical protein